MFRAGRAFLSGCAYRSSTSCSLAAYTCSGPPKANRRGSPPRIPRDWERGFRQPRFDRNGRTWGRQPTCRSYTIRSGCEGASRGENCCHSAHLLREPIYKYEKVAPDLQENPEAWNWSRTIGSFARDPHWLCVTIPTPRRKSSPKTVFLNSPKCLLDCRIDSHP